MGPKKYLATKESTSEFLHPLSFNLWKFELTGSELLSSHSTAAHFYLEGNLLLSVFGTVTVALTLEPKLRLTLSEVRGVMHTSSKDG
ncbi:unnamed protein product [Enterobius vermicularis]|uniref:LAM_G_DOMAIN domain-containing protein n=1 Tax=Enterobius vermicularis TaxID=51028 RepID=A0A0N4V006_ENTVE|nr:unnamed protein product [Enterobius vermicularis]